jgi:hypothetical protein
LDRIGLNDNVTCKIIEALPRMQVPSMKQYPGRPIANFSRELSGEFGLAASSVSDNGG